jgi:RNA polymerase sigma factor (sigma-70 family)
MDTQTAVEVPSHNSTDPVDYLNFARMRAAPYARREGVAIDDSEAFADACLAMSRSRRSYRRDGGAKFITYAGTAIKFAISQGYRERVHGWAPSGLKLRRPSICVKSLGEYSEAVPAGVSYSPVADLELQDIRDHVRSAVALLPVNLRRVVSRRMEGETLQVIADDLGVSRQRVQQIESLAHRMLRDLLAEYQLEAPS